MLGTLEQGAQQHTMNKTYRASQNCNNLEHCKNRPRLKGSIINKCLFLRERGKCEWLLCQIQITR